MSDIKQRARALAWRTYRGHSYPCSSCGDNINIHLHHEDYSKPLDVIPLCHKCHWEFPYKKQLIEFMNENKELPMDKIVALFSFKSGLTVKKIYQIIDRHKYPSDVVSYYTEEMCGCKSKEGYICIREKNHDGEHGSLVIVEEGFKEVEKYTHWKNNSTDAITESNEVRQCYKGCYNV